jgi:hypothetical protein
MVWKRADKHLQKRIIKYQSTEGAVGGGGGDLCAGEAISRGCELNVWLVKKWSILTWLRSYEPISCKEENRTHSCFSNSLRFTPPHWIIYFSSGSCPPFDSAAQSDDLVLPPSLSVSRSLSFYTRKTIKKKRRDETKALKSRSFGLP